MPPSLRIPLFLLLGLLPGPYRGSCDAPTTTFRSELENLEVMKSRLLIDFPASSYSESPRVPRRLMYLENRGDSDPLLRPQQWAVGISSPLITAGPVSLRGILAQLYNPLAHAPGSEVYSDPAELSLNIGLEVAGRRGLQLQAVPGHWNLLGIYKEQIGAQLGSVITAPLGRRIDCVLVGLLAGPPDRLADEQTWYAEKAIFPGGLISHLAGSLAWELNPFRFCLIAAASAGQWVGPGTFTTMHLSWRDRQIDLDLLLGYCSSGYLTPEGDIGELEWMIAGRAKRDLGPLQLSAACRREIDRLPVLPAEFRESLDQLNAGIEIIRKTACGSVWSITGGSELEREWSRDGDGHSRFSLDAGSTVDWSLWSFAVQLKEAWGGGSERFRDFRVEIARNPSWGEARLEAGYRHSLKSGFRLAAALEAAGGGKRIYIRLETKEILPPIDSGDGRQAEDWLQLFTLRVGWEAKSRQR